MVMNGRIRDNVGLDFELEFKSDLQPAGFWVGLLRALGLKTTIGYLRSEFGSDFDIFLAFSSPLLFHAGRPGDVLSLICSPRPREADPAL